MITEKLENGVFTSESNGELLLTITDLGNNTYRAINKFTDMTAEGLNIHRHVADRAKLLYASIAGGCTELNLIAKKNSSFLPENVGRR